MSHKIDGLKYKGRIVHKNCTLGVSYKWFIIKGGLKNLNKGL